MSRMSASEVINRGDYLQPDFEPSTLTIPHLLSVLTYHGIKYPTPHNKAKLVDVFNAEIKPRSAELLRERRIREGKKPSHEGILDGHTGQAIRSPEPAPVRRSTRRSSQQPPDVVPAPEPAPVVKRRRSSAGPTMSRSGSRMQQQVPVQPALAEESESEVAADKSPPRKTTRTKGPSARERRRSAGLSDNNDSAWEDNNVFQSGAEDSSPARPPPVRHQPKPARTGPPPVTRRVSKRSSLSAPPQARPPTRSPAPEVPPEALPDPVIEPQSFQNVPTSSTFTPRLARTINVPTGGLQAFNPPPSQIRKSIAAAEASAIVDAAESSEEEEEEETQKPTNQAVSPRGAPDLADEEAVLDEIDNTVVTEAADVDEEVDQSYETIDEPFEYDAAVAKRIAAIGKDAAAGRALVRRDDIRPPPVFPNWLSATLGLAFALFFSTIINYRSESSSIGWCDTGSDTNSIIMDRKAAFEARRECAQKLYINPSLEKFGMLEPSPESSVISAKDLVEGMVGDCPPTPLFPVPRPFTCTPCPKHATCSPPHGITCEPTYILKHHPLASIPGLREVASGLPGFGAVAFPPQCVEDDALKRKVTGVAKWMSNYLENIKGERICAGITAEGKEVDGGLARKFGVQVDDLLELIVDNVRQRSTTVKEDVGSIFANAMKEVENYGLVERSTDSNGVEWVAAKRATMDMTCRARVGVRDAWSEWQMHFYSLIGTVLSAIWARSKIASKRRESRRVADLAGVALDLVRNQEIAHHTDPVRAPHTYISSLHLRDMILQDEHNIRERVRLWNKVAKIVEGNANVRANEEEVAGDETRVWRWVGASRAI
ncbi:sulfide-quinone oxidoreductase [Ceratobasidium sp. AG-Ba]|nr:sulfide-quinone oxidoreductase [Ceratobasidium sp. AG-Ba]QRW14880.1 sulfide-quinone oxidoreductase [Ceratobasidium sp. AG-Ba]